MEIFKKIKLRKVLFAFLGVAILALGASILNVAGVGLDPNTAMNSGISSKLGTSLGIFQLCANAVILLFVFIFGRKLIGIGTVINMVLAGFLIDGFSSLYYKLFSFQMTFTYQVIYLIVGVLLFTLGASLYMSANLGNAPYDAIAPIIVEKTNFEYRKVRVCQDVIVVLIAFCFSGPIGVGTVINAFFTGPLIDFWNKKVSHPLIGE